MEKNTPTEFDIHPLIKNRWSPRVFSDKQVTEQEMHQLLEAGRWAPSSNNFQPWRIIWGLKGSETYDRIFKCLLPFNQQWAGNGTALMAGIFKKSMPNGKENFHAIHDLGLFMGNVSLQAQSMGIALHQMAGIDFKKAAKEFGISDEYHVATATAIGYYGGDADELPEDLQKPETNPDRQRIEQSEFAFVEDFESLKEE